MRNMQLDPDTACARTAAGESELLAATHGLSLGQRRVLTLLESPRSIASLAAEHRLDVVKLDRDLARLAELKLILLLPHGADSSAPASDRGNPADPLGVGRSLRPARIAGVIGGAAALTVAVLVFIGARATLETDAKGDSGTARPSRATNVAPIVALSAPAVVTTESPPPVTQPTMREAENTTPAQTVLPSSRPLAPTVPAAAAVHPAPPAPSLPIMTATPHGLGPLVAKANIAGATAAPAAQNALMPAFVSATGGIGNTAAPAPSAATPATVPAPATNLATVPTDPVTASPVAPPLPPPVQMAMVAPTGPPTRATVNSEVRALSREPPAFPREAKSAGVTSGVVKARLGLDAKGNVTGVEILEAKPPRVFDRAVRSALGRWSFEPGSGVASVDIEVDFKSE
jgi:TonB family protein